MASSELRRSQGDDVAAVRATRGNPEEAALAWVRRQQARPLSVGISCAFAPIGQPTARYLGLIRRPRLEMGVARTHGDGELVFSAHRQVVGIGYWIAPDAQGDGLATRAAMLLSRWTLQSAGMIRVEAPLNPHNIASRRVVAVRSSSVGGGAARRIRAGHARGTPIPLASWEQCSRGVRPGGRALATSAPRRRTR